MSIVSTGGNTSPSGNLKGRATAKAMKAETRIVEGLILAGFGRASLSFRVCLIVAGAAPEPVKSPREEKRKRPVDQRQSMPSKKKECTRRREGIQT